MEYLPERIRDKPQKLMEVDVTDVRELYDDVVRFETALWDAVDARLREECGLRLTWFEIMQLLEADSDIRVRDIAHRLAITVGGVSKILDRLTAAGYCLRRPNPADGRSAFVSLTGEGRTMLSTAIPVFEKELDLRFRGVLGPRELARFGAAVQLLRESICNRGGDA